MIININPNTSDIIELQAYFQGLAFVVIKLCSSEVGNIYNNYCVQLYIT